MAQAFIDMPPPRLNPKTCCGRSICMCHHAPGAACPFRRAHQNETSSMGASGHCKLKKHDQGGPVKDKLPASRTGLTKAPCASDSPKMLLPQVEKDFVLPHHSTGVLLMLHGTVFMPRICDLPLDPARRIERPPKISAF